MNKQNQWIIGFIVIIIILLGIIVFLFGRGEDASNATPTTIGNNITSTLTRVTATFTHTPMATLLPAPITTISVPTNTPIIVLTNTPLPTFIPSITPTPLPTSSPSPTITPTPQPTIIPTPNNAPAWLQYTNRLRQIAGLANLKEDNTLSLGSRLHSQYLVVNDSVDDPHGQDVRNPLYSDLGAQSGENGNVFATSQVQANYTWAIDYWISAPFHLLPLINPHLQTVGYGRYQESVGTIHMVGVMDVRSAPRLTNPNVTYPLYFPQDGGDTWVLQNSLFEWPNPLNSCPGYSRPSGPPLVLQLGTGDITPNVMSHAFFRGGTELLDSCVFTETTYQSTSVYSQNVGRTILDAQDAVVVIPRQPLAINQTYTVVIIIWNQTYTWQFHTVVHPDV